MGPVPCIAFRYYGTGPIAHMGLQNITSLEDVTFPFSTNQKPRKKLTHGRQTDDGRTEK